MYEKLLTLTNKPVLNFPDTARLYYNLWEDEHISKGMLASHLNPTEDGATNNHAFVAKSVRWITRQAPPIEFPKLLDLGCGPGIYAELFAKEGYSVTGIDYSTRSIVYAIIKSAANSSGIEYMHQNYLTIDFTARFDLVTLINKDYF